MQLRQTLVSLLLAAGVSGCSGTPFGDQLSRSFSQPPATPAAPTAKPAVATPAAKPATQAQTPKSEPTKPVAKPAPPAPPLTPAPYRVTIKLPAADPSSPAHTGSYHH